LKVASTVGNMGQDDPGIKVDWREARRRKVLQLNRLLWERAGPRGHGIKVDFVEHFDARGMLWIPGQGDGDSEMIVMAVPK